MIFERPHGSGTAERLVLRADKVLVDGAFRSGVDVVVQDGVIVAIEPPPASPARAPARTAATKADGRREAALPVLELPRRALLPGTVNAHNHSFQSLLRGIGDDLPFFEWRDKGLYHCARRLDARGIHAGALLAFGEMLLRGVTTVCDFFYIHAGGNENDRAVARAARELGIRLQLARTLYDWDGAPESFRETVPESTARARALHAELCGDTLVSFAVAPHSPHGASAPMIAAGAALSAELEVPLHVHCAEGEYEVEQTLREHGKTPLRYLDGLGAVGARTVVVHGVWLDDGEIARMAEAGASLAYNPASNMFLGDGIARLPEYDARGVNVALGSDGGCSNNQVSVFGEMRMCALLQKVARRDGATLSAEKVLAWGTRGGARALGLPVGEIAPGRRADLVAVDLDDLSLQPEGPLLKNVVYAMASNAVTDVWVEGRRVVKERALASYDVAEIRRRVAETVALF
ncbi:MAG TPA: amidohydrolase [Myxococcota bacterium]|jgi:5-methylthioadenosine/S-adenosylhomocysteine deaminase|nr:amidohydrolase [Myxococcota bacterium]